jgi:hypothetical protein
MKKSKDFISLADKAKHVSIKKKSGDGGKDVYVGTVSLTGGAIDQQVRSNTPVGVIVKLLNNEGMKD